MVCDENDGVAAREAEAMEEAIDEIDGAPGERHRWRGDVLELQEFSRAHLHYYRVQ